MAKPWYFKFRYELLGAALFAVWLWAFCASHPTNTPPAPEYAPTAPAVAPAQPASHTPPPEFMLAVEQDAKRDAAWARVRRLHLKREPYCAWCGGTTDLQVHHIHPFALNPTLHGSTAPGGELDDGVDGTGKDGNLITLCMVPAKVAKDPEEADHHERYGHSGHFHGGENLAVRSQCNAHQLEMEKAGKWPLGK